ncbi:MAG: GreA/GreB family elongation factor [Victivallaceae bacterium]|jgi:regulator of nucleoside diphosphate kinase|nr:GreA/GreB family elongation factor [Victivallaceae bacterium]
MPERIVSKSDFEKINYILESMFGSNPESFDGFAKVLDSAKKLNDEQMPDNIVMLDSCVELFDVGNQELMLKKIVLPPADFDTQELSVFSPVGMSVFGLKAGETIDCKVPGGIRRIEVRNILDYCQTGFT